MAFTADALWAEAPGDDALSLAPAQIVEQIQSHNQAQAAELKQYTALRHYQVAYRSFSAAMDVKVSYDARTGKSFRVVSQSGSPMLCDKVLRRAMESEREAWQKKDSMALTEANYRFRLDGTDRVLGRPAYVLEVEPLTDSKFLYRGKVWVDAADFAVVKMETEPARSPSFWIERTQIHWMNAKTSGFWLPRQVRSETRVRIGGTAVLTIDYGSYEVVPEVALQTAGP